MTCSTFPYSEYYAAGGGLPNNLKTLLSRMLQVGDFRTDNNSWREPPEAVVEKGMKAVNEYFVDLFAEGRSIQRTSVKVVLVGQEGAGKTR